MRSENAQHYPTVGRMMPQPHPKMSILIPRICVHVSLYGNRGFADVIKVKDVEVEKSSRFIQVGQI